MVFAGADGSGRLPSGLSAGATKYEKRHALWNGSH